MLPLLWTLARVLATDPALGEAPEDAAREVRSPEDDPPVEGPPARAVPERWTLPPDVVAVAQAAARLPLPERLEVVSRPFLGLPYQVDAAGEGAPPDPDPVARYDRFDCLTFVEEVLGLALAGDPLYAPAIRDALRYDGPPDYAHRRHFMEAEWIPDALRNGLLRDITAEVGDSRLLTHDVTRAMWQAWGRRALFRLPDARLPVGTWQLRYLDLDAAEAAVARIPPGALIVTLRIPRTWNPTVTTHVSMAIPGKAETMMRHATRMSTRRVRDDRLAWYVHHLREYVNWPALGIAVLYPREQGPRAALVPTPAPSAAPSATPPAVP